MKEGGKHQISIAQIKEVMKLIFTELAEMDVIDALKIIRKYKQTERQSDYY